MAVPKRLQALRFMEGVYFNIWFVLSIAVTTFLIILLAWHLVYSNELVESFENRELAVQRLSGELLRYTKSLEMSANMAAATGDLKWEIEYRDYRSRLDEVFDTIPVLVETPEVLAEIDDIRQYRRELDEIENKVLNLVARGEKRAAADLLAGWVYTRSQLNIIASTENLAMIMHDYIEQRIAHEQRMTSALLTVLAVCLLVLIFSWFVTITIWRANMKKKQEKDEVVRYLSYHDALTGLNNRAFLEAEMEQVDNDDNLPISVIMLDFNGLKLVNDTFGHEAGDAVLMRGAELLRGACRDVDTLARWGGDEFVILLPKTSREGARLICERILEECRKTYSSSAPVSMALGVATKESPGERLGKFLKTAEDEMYNHKLSESPSARKAALQAMLQSLADKSCEDEEHANRLAHTAERVGAKMDLPVSELARLKLLAQFHDIGMVNLAEETMTKKGPLTREEWAEVKKHPETGYRIARSTKEYAHVAREIMCHHECWDGGGYPEGLKGEDIPLLSRIFCVVDTFDVMRSERPYNKARSFEAVITELKLCSGSQFDPAVVEVMLEVIANNDLVEACDPRR